MTWAWYIKEPLRNKTEIFLISKLCFPWLVSTIKRSSSTHHYLTSSKLPFNTETTKKFHGWKENYGEITYVVGHLTNYNLWIHQFSSVSLNLNLWFEIILAIGHLVNFWHLWFLRRTINEEQRASKTEKKIDHGNVLSQKMGCVAVYSRSLRAKRKKRTSPDRLKIRRDCIKTLDFSISIYIIMLHLFINAFKCSWYVSNTYHSPLIVHVSATYCIRSTPVYWSRLGRSCYGTDMYLPSCYSRCECLFRTHSVATDLVTSPEIQPIRCAFMLNHSGRTRNCSVTT